MTSLKSGNVQGLKLKLTKRNDIPNLTFEVLLGGAISSWVLHDLPVTVRKCFLLSIFCLVILSIKARIVNIPIFRFNRRRRFMKCPLFYVWFNLIYWLGNWRKGVNVTSAKRNIFSICEYSGQYILIFKTVMSRIKLNSNA